MRQTMVDLWAQEQVHLEADLPRDKWPFGRHLTTEGWTAFLAAMPSALAGHDMVWLAERMNAHALWETYYLQHRRTGTVRARVGQPNALIMLTYGEFNTAYVRAVATTALQEGISTSVIYRAAPAGYPRDTCTYMEGAQIACTAILSGHRAYHTGELAEISIPAGPNCHHSILVPTWVNQS